MFNNKLKKMEKRRKLPKVVMAASVAMLGMGLFSTLQNEARATGGGGSSKCLACVDRPNRYDCVPNGTGLMICSANAPGSVCCGNSID